MKALTLILTFLALTLAAQGQLNPMTQVGVYNGEAPGDGFSVAMTMGDFDDDGRDEFIIGACGWNESRGKNYYYDWNGDWPTEPTWTLQGDGQWSPYDLVDANIGDVNGDGIVDFGLVKAGIGGPSRLDLLFGSAAFDSIADWSMGSGIPMIEFFMSLDSCGDVNGDGGNDFVGHCEEGVSHYGEMRIYFGGELLDTIPDWTYPTPDQFVYGLGDINGDGYADIMINWWNDEPPKVFFGGNPMDTIPDLIPNGISVGAAGGAVGDINADGYNDFAIDLLLEDSTNSYGYIFYGGPDVDNVPDEVLLNHFSQQWGFEAICRGNFNGDSYDDFAVGSGNPYIGDLVYIYLGSPNFNPFPDAIMTDWSVYNNFGYTLTSGDVDGDSCDELLVGAKNANGSQGMAILYQGPEEWIDHGAAVHPEHLPRHPGWFKLDQNYPNPFNSSTSIHFEIGKPSTVNLIIYDLKGDLIKRVISPKDFLPGGYNVSWNGKNEQNQPVSSGIYLLELQVDQYRQLRKIALLR